jgi:NitT/TauT family transport system ATP-binding protein
LSLYLACITIPQLKCSMQTLDPKNRTRIGLTIEGLFYSYSDHEVFRNFSLRSQSNLVVLRGPSGCGKTTLLKLLSGNLEPDQPAAQPPTKGACLVLQEDSLMPWLSGIDNISLFMRIPHEQFRTHPMYELVQSFVDRKACNMSYGQRRMVELFRAILFRPPYLYLDEPFNFLDEDRMGLVAPFLRRELLKDTLIVLSNHHQDDGAIVKGAQTFKFDGQFPVTSLRQIQ